MNPLTLTTKYPWMLTDSKPCACNKCQGMCHRPCWPVPEEADRLIDLGYADKMMSDYWVRHTGDAYDPIYIICPAHVGSEGRQAPSWPEGKCTLLEMGLCTIHDIGKPYEGRAAHHDRNLASTSHGDHHKLVAKSWDTDYGRQVVKRWQEVVGW